jgi:hypothetical protein
MHPFRTSSRQQISSERVFAIADMCAILMETENPFGRLGV